uniref:Major sperm protein n=1 Tax=Angiostrongylus cantonensis TaxID=6313 RepID=A0A158P6A1_ANGCA
MATEKVTFVPSKSVTFMPNGSKQMAEMTVTNESDKTIIFKMKSTKPGMFKMRPVYGAVGPNDKLNCNCYLQDTFRRPTTVPSPDYCSDFSPQCASFSMDSNQDKRFTMVVAVAPSTSINTEKVWKMQKYQQRLAENETTKKRFRILFFGVNDQEEDEEDGRKESKEKDNKCINEGDPAADKDKAAKQLVLVMYRDRKDNSISGEEDDEETTYQPVPQQAVKTNAAQGKASVTRPQTNVAQKRQSVGVTANMQAGKAIPTSKVPTAQQQKSIAQLDDNLIGTKTCRENKNFEQRPQVAGK